MSLETQSFADAFSRDVFNCLTDAGLIRGAGRVRINFTLSPSDDGAESPVLCPNANYWATRVYAGMDDAPKDRPFLARYHPCAEYGEWDVTFWQVAYQGKPCGFWNRNLYATEDPSNKVFPLAFTHWTELPGNP